jgi:hypothetical protein
MGVGEAEMRVRECGEIAEVLRSGREKRSCGRSRCNNLGGSLADIASILVS